MRSGVKHSVAVTVVGAALLASGCASIMGPPPTAEEIVAERAQERLDALLAGDLDKAYSFFSPASQAVYEKADLASAYAGAGRWTAAKVTSVSCEPLRCEVVYLIDYKMVRPALENSRPIAEVWINVDGKWYATKP